MQLISTIPKARHHPAHGRHRESTRNVRFALPDRICWGGGLFDILGTKPDSTLWKGTSMRRFLFTVLSVCLLSTGVFAQTSGSPGGLVVFETFGFGVGTAATQAGVLPGVMITQTVLFAAADARLDSANALESARRCAAQTRPLVHGAFHRAPPRRPSSDRQSSPASAIS